MKRLGKFSGKIYDEDDIEYMLECCRIIPDDKINDKGYIDDMHIKDLLFCEQCMSCPRSRK